MKTTASTAIPALLASLLVLTGCGSGGGGGGGGAATPKSNTQQVETYATVSRDGSWARVDLVDGGLPVRDPSDPADPGNLAPNKSKQVFLNQLLSFSGTDLDANLQDTNGDGIGDTGFDTYQSGLGQAKSGARILGANNLYDLFQTTTGKPVLFNPVSGVEGGPPFTGGDSTGDGVPDGGPGLFSNLGKIPGMTSLVPALPPLPNTMGSGTGSGVGPSPDDQHQFIQIVFPYKLNRDSLFDPTAADNSFLGDSSLGASDNVFIQGSWVSRADYLPADDGGNEDVNVLNNMRHVPGIAIIGGVAAVPAQQGFQTLSRVDTDLSNLPEGCKALVDKPNVFTYIAHENPALISPVSSPDIGRIDLTTNTLILPDPTDPGGKGGRVFGATADIPSSINDFATDPYDPSDDAQLAAQTNRRLGFFSVRITRLRSTKSTTIESPYFHTFPMSQAQVGADPMAVNGSFNRGPAIAVDPEKEIPAIEVLDPSKHYIPGVNLGVAPPPSSDAANNPISTRTRFVVEFDKEVVPNSVGFSRRFTIHSVPGKGIVFPFNGNTRPITSPAANFVGGSLGSPLAPSVYVAVNQPAQRAVNNPFAKDANLDGNKDDGTPILPGSTPAQQAALSGLYPGAHNTMATLPRGVVPCDIYPINQNNLQKYVVEPLVELPPGSVVTVGVCVQGLGLSNNQLPAVIPTPPTNMGNFTRAGTVFTPWQGLNPDGLGDSDVSSKQAIIGNATIVKVNAGPMDLEGLLFFGGTTTALDTLIDGDPNGDNNRTAGGFNVCRTFRVANDANDTYVNAPVSPMALYVGFNNQGVGVLDLCGTGFNTNKPGGGADNTGFEDRLVVSRLLSTAISGGTTTTNWLSNGAAAGGDHQAAFGILGRYTAGGCSFCTPISYESELAIGTRLPLGPATPVPGINEGSSGYETMVRDNEGSQFLTRNKLGLARDIVVGDFLDTVFYDIANIFAVTANHRSYNAPAEGAVQNNTISDPPFPNPPPLRFPVGLPHTAVAFDQNDLSRAPFIIEGNEVFSNDAFMRYNDGTGVAPFTFLVNTFIQLNPTTNQSNPNSFDVPPLPNAGFPNPFLGAAFSSIPKFVQMGPMPKTSTAGAVVLSTLNAGGGPYDPGGLEAPSYQSRQQIGNFLFVTDGVNKKLHALNSNTMEIIESLTLPDPYGLALTSNLETVYVSNEGDNTVSVVDADPRSATFMTELKRVKVGQGPRGIAAAPDNEDVLVLNRLGNTMSIIDVGTNTVRRTISESGINRPNDICAGMREVSGGPAFQSGTYHAFISNGGGDNILVYESGPSGVAGIGFDNVLGEVRPGQPSTIGNPELLDMKQPRGIAYDPNAPLDTFSHTIGCYVAHNDPVSGRAMISRLVYTKDSSPGINVFDATFANPSFGEKVFEIVQQYVSDYTGIAHDVALPDYNRKIFEQSDFKTNSNLLNAGASVSGISGGASAGAFPRNAKYPLASNVSPAFANGPRWNPDRIYLAIGSNVIDVFEIATGQHLKTIPTAGTPTVLTGYFGQ